jgi:uncharacterized membrane protein YvlD (DUF360 family)
MPHAATHGGPGWTPARRPLTLRGLIVALVILTVSVYVAAWLAPDVALEAAGSALLVALVIALLDALVPPVVAALPLPYAFLLGFVLVLLLDGAMLWLAGQVFPGAVHVGSFWAALLASLLIAAVSIVVSMLIGADDEAVSLAVLKRIAKRQGVIGRGDTPGIVFLEIDGLAEPVLRRAMAGGHAPNLARWLDEQGYRLAGWETDLSSQTGASQAGILHGSNDDIPAFRWVEKESGRIVACSAPGDCALLEQRHSRGRGLLAGGGASRGNLLSGEADEVILTVSRLSEERGPNPGYRAFLASGSNAMRALVLFFWEIVMERLAAARQRRRDVTPRGHRGGTYPLIRATMCTLVRDLIVFGVLTDLMRGRPAVYATFSSYDEVAHHSGLERADTLEALRKLDERLGRIARMRAFAPRPYEIVVLSDHGQTQGATFRQRHGYGLDDLVQRSLAHGGVTGIAGGDEQDAMVDHAIREAGGGGGRRRKRDKQDVSGRDVVVLGSGNLGLVYLMEAGHRMTLEEIQLRHPDLIPALRGHDHIGWLLVRSAGHGAMVLGPGGSLRLADGHVDGEDPLAPFGPGAARHLLRTDGFAHTADIMVGSFFDAERDEGCAFEELISFHGGLGGAQTRPFLLVPPGLDLPARPLIGAGAINDLLRGWRRTLQGAVAPADRVEVIR